MCFLVSEWIAALSVTLATVRSVSGRFSVAKYLVWLREAYQSECLSLRGQKREVEVKERWSDRPSLSPMCLKRQCMCMCLSMTIEQYHLPIHPLLSPWNTIRRHFWSCTGKLFIFCNEEVCRAPNISRKIGLPALPWTKVVVWGTGRSSMKQKLRTHWHSHSSEHSQHFFLIFNFYLIFFINHSHIHTSVLFFCA